MRKIRSFFSNVACLTIGCLVAATCTTSTDPTPVASLALLPALDSIEVGQTYDSWIVVAKDASGKTLEGRQVAWEARTQSVATVDRNSGVVTAVAPGETAIIIKADGQEAISSIRVLQPVMGVVALPDSMDVALTTTRQISVQVIGPNGTALTNRAVAFSSDDPATVVVNGSGLVTPLKLGITSVRVRVAGVLRATVRVRVIGEPVAGVRILPLEAFMLVRVGQTRQLTAECLSATNAVLPGRPLVWSSTNPAVAAIDQSGVVTGVSLGSATIAVRCDNTATGTVSMSVTPVRVASVAITPATLDVRFGTQAQLNAVPRDSVGTILSIVGRTVVWETNNFPVAMVNQSGLVGGNGNGTAEIKVTVDGVQSPPAIITVWTPPEFAVNPVPPWSRTTSTSGNTR